MLPCDLLRGLPHLAGRSTSGTLPTGPNRTGPTLPRCRRGPIRGDLTVRRRMIVTCPACATRYLVDPRALGSAGRTVRCANCAQTWHQTPPEDLPLTVALEVDEVRDR